MSDIELTSLVYTKVEIESQRTFDKAETDTLLHLKVDTQSLGSPSGTARLNNTGTHEPVEIPFSSVAEVQDPTNETTVVNPKRLHYMLGASTGAITQSYLEGHYYDKTVIDGLLRGVVNQFTGVGAPDAALGNTGDTYTETVAGTTVTTTIFEGDSYHGWDNVYDSYTLNSGNAAEPWISIDIAKLQLSMIASGSATIPTVHDAMLIIDGVPPMKLTINGETSSHVAGAIHAADTSIPDASLTTQLRAVPGHPHYKITAEVTTGGTSTVHWEKLATGWIKTNPNNHNDVPAGPVSGMYFGMEQADNVDITTIAPYRLVFSEPLPTGVYEGYVSFIASNVVGGPFSAAYDLEGGNSFKPIMHTQESGSQRFIVQHNPSNGLGVLEAMLEVIIVGSMTLEDVYLTIERKL